MNSSEEAAYWYLRLNGFFPITNFVIHKSDNIQFTSDADLIAIRHPYVYEEIGGRPEDWDENLFDNFSEGTTIGLICQVKGGAISNRKLFKEPYVTSSINRMGFTSEVGHISKALAQSALTTYMNEQGSKFQIAKLLIARDIPQRNEPFIALTLKHIHSFIENRIKKYPKHKYRDRNFFCSNAFQTIIELEHLKNNGG